jgi:hypothetical protein
MCGSCAVTSLDTRLGRLSYTGLPDAEAHDYRVVDIADHQGGIGRTLLVR